MGRWKNTDDPKVARKCEKERLKKELQRKKEREKNGRTVKTRKPNEEGLSHERRKAFKARVESKYTASEWKRKKAREARKAGKPAPRYENDSKKKRLKVVLENYGKARMETVTDPESGRTYSVRLKKMYPKKGKKASSTRGKSVNDVMEEVGLKWIEEKGTEALQLKAKVGQLSKATQERAFASHLKLRDGDVKDEGRVLCMADGTIAAKGQKVTKYDGPFYARKAIERGKNAAASAVCEMEMTYNTSKARNKYYICPGKELARKPQTMKALKEVMKGDYSPLMLGAHFIQDPYLVKRDGKIVRRVTKKGRRMVNCEMKKDGWIYATKVIRGGCKLYMDYGEEYYSSLVEE